MAYITPSDIAGGFSSSLYGAQNQRVSLAQAAQLKRMREQQMALDASAEQRRQAEETQNAALRPLELRAKQYAIRGQILGPTNTADQYEQALGEVQSLGLPTGDLPEARNESQAWLTFAKKPEVTGFKSWIPEKWRPAGTALPVAPSELPSGDLSAKSVDMDAVRSASERGLPIAQQEKFAQADLARQIQLANLERNLDKDALSREWMQFQREAKMQGMTDAEAQREFQRNIEGARLGLDVQRLELQKEQEKRTAATSPKFTADQSNAAVYGRRIEQGLSDLSRIGQSGFNPTSMLDAAQVRGLVTATPGVKLVASPEARQTAQAYRNIINAILRRESGAAIAPSEFENAQQQYFPALGDDPGTLAQKQRNLEQALAGFKTGAGAAWEATPLVSTKPEAKPRAEQQTQQTRTARTTDEFNRIWATMKPGETLVAPNGKTYQKGGSR